MNAFPSELLHHHFACMVVAGLTPPTKISAPSTTAAAAAITPSSSAAAAASAPSSSANPTETSSSTAEATAPADHPTSVFPDLARSLHDILASRARNTLWDPSRGRAAVFHSVFADHFVRLPPLKTKPSARHVPPIPSITSGSTATSSEASTSAFSALPPRSPLSPLHPNSPQFPDGLIAPVWVRKHRELVPSVFVSFYCLPTASDLEQLRKSDEALIKTISERRRTLTERGIKLTVVLLTQRETLDDPRLEARLSFVRRNSGLDSRASLFVLTPVTKPELAEFVTSLHSALFESAADYYREHARRVKRKRTRYPPPSSTLQPLATAIGTLPSLLPSGKTLGVADISWLSREGWIVRSEYKLAIFAELAGDMQEAALRYREAYDLLCNSPTCLLGSTLMLPPRTKRWAEAKVLADTLSIRICKLLLYADDGEGAAVFLRRHLARFTELSTGWGIGAMTFEYWSWLAKQYRLFGELVEHATRQVVGSPLPPFQLAVHSPPLPSKLIHPDALPRFSDGRGGVVAPPGMLLPNANAVAVSTCPYTTLQPPGAYYYLAALCTLERRQRFLRANTGVEEDESSPLSHERKVDHTAHLTESLTKAYDSFKRNRQHRAALLVAARIATAYHDGGQHEMALKFLERILKSYDRENVWGVKQSLIETAVQAAIGAGDRRSAVRVLVEVLDPILALERRGEMVDALRRFLSQSGDDDEEKGDEREVGGVKAGFLSLQMTFPAAEVEYGAEVPFQVVLRNVGESFDSRDVLTVDRLTLRVQSGDEAKESLVEIPSTDDEPPLIAELGQLDLSSSSLECKPAKLNTLFSHSAIAFQGRFKPHQQGAVRIVAATVHASAGNLKLPLEIALPEEADHAGLTNVEWLLPSGRSISLTQRPNPSSALVLPKRLNLSLSITAPPSAYLDERTPVRICIENGEDAPVHAWIDAALQPSYDGALDMLCEQIEVEEGEKPRQSIAVQVELAARAKEERVVWLTAKQAAGSRVVDVSVRVEDEVVRRERAEVRVERLFEYRVWTRGGEGREVLLELDEVEEVEKRVVGLDVEMVGVDTVEVTGVEVGGEQLTSATGEWAMGDRFSFTSLASSPHWALTWHRLTTSVSQTTLITIPSPTPPTPHLTLTLTYPTSTTLLTPLPLHLTLHNPTAHTLSLVLTLDSDGHFTLAAARRLSIPHLLPGQSLELRHFARLIPQCVGVWRLPNLQCRLVDPSNPNVSLGVSATDASADAEGGEEIVFKYVVDGGEQAEEGEQGRLPKIIVTL